MSINLALHTTQVPYLISPHQELVTIIDLTPERAAELLDLMAEITKRAATSSTTFKISSFETNALYVPAYALRHLPSPHNFIVLPKDYSVTAVTPIKLVHANVMPHFINWSATHEDNQFTVHTADLPAEVLHLVACGQTLPPGTTANAPIASNQPPNQFLISKKVTYIH